MKKLNTSKEIEAFALKKVASQDWTYFLLQRKIVEKTEFPELIDEVLIEFVEKGWINDQRFAERYAISSRDKKGYGPLKIESMLLNKGVSSNIISKVLHENHPIWDKNAFEIREKKYGNIPTEIKEKYKQSNFLQSRGFTLEQIETSFLSQLPDKCLDFTLPEEDVEEINIEDITNLL
jgi:regulatory protein